MEKAATIQELTELVRAFCEERDWNQFHNPKDLAIGISTEAGELLEIFRFMSQEQMKAQLQDAATREHIEEELADVLFFVLRFAQMNHIELDKCLQDKVAKNGTKYPVEISRGSNQKHSSR